MKSLENQIAELTESLRLAGVENERLKGVIASADKTVAAAQLATMCKEAGLPEVAVEKLKVAFKDAVNVNGMQEAVNTEKKYVETIKESAGTQTRIARNNGAASEVKEGDAKLQELREAQVKAFTASGYDEKTAKAMAGIE